MTGKLDDARLLHMVRSGFAPGDLPTHVAVAVSGGGDSMALLLLMQRWAEENDVGFSAVTVNHGLRPEAADEAAMVAQFCAGRGIAHDTLTWQGWNGTGWDGTGNLQAAARAARYGLMADWARDKGVDIICLGHTNDDQAETILMRLARKAGSDGLRGMAARFDRDGMTWARPLLPAARADLRAFLTRQGVAWVEDPSNDNDRYDRVKARKALACLEPLGLGAEALSAVAANLAGENDFLRRALADTLSGRVTEHFGALSLPCDVFDGLHPEMRRRFLNAAIRWITGAGHAPRAMAEAALITALRAGKTHTLGGCIGWRARGRVWLAREMQAVAPLRGTPFDGCWQVDGPPEPGTEIRALGPNGLKQVPDWHDLGVPGRVLHPLPGVWEGQTLVAAPLLDGKKRYKTTLTRPTFNMWLSQH